MPAALTRALTALALISIGAKAIATPRPTIIELYTSEGCSSCPPAEKLVEELATRPGLLPLAFHVDYWDDLGWRDRFSMKQATERQRAFARSLRLSTVGTPQLIVDGRTAVWGANPTALSRALEAPRSDVPVVLERKGPVLVVRAPTTDAPEPYDVYVVGYLPKAVTSIRRGENAGRTITEVNVVRYVGRIGRSRDTIRTWSFSLATLPPDAERVVVLLQASGSGTILGAQSIDAAR